jgi:hypothetical protein
VTLKIDSEHSLEMQVSNCYTMQKCRRKPSGDQQVLQNFTVYLKTWVMIYRGADKSLA